jgi:hypothetical protein
MPRSRSFEAHPLSAPGDFYVIDFYVINDECICCGTPHHVAPDLISWADESMRHCIWKKQPQTLQEMEQDIAAVQVCCVGRYRYAGDNPAIVTRIGREYCDWPAKE